MVLLVNDWRVFAESEVVIKQNLDLLINFSEPIEENPETTHPSHLVSH